MRRAQRCFMTWRKGDDQGNQDEKATPRVAHSHCGKTVPTGGECVEVCGENAGRATSTQTSGSGGLGGPSGHNGARGPGAQRKLGRDSRGIQTDSTCWLITVSGPASSPASLQGQAVLRPQGAPHQSSGNRGVGPAQMGK